MEKSELVKAKSSALSLLARREHTRKELSTKLSKKFDYQVVDETVLLLSQGGAVSDKRFAEMLVRSRFNRGFGPIYITKELRFKGVDQEISKECLEVFDGRWLGRAEELVQKKKSKNLGLENDRASKNSDEAMSDSKKLEDKLMRFLVGRGFPSEVVFKLF